MTSFDSPLQSVITRYQQQLSAGRMIGDQDLNMVIGFGSRFGKFDIHTTINMPTNASRRCFTGIEYNGGSLPFVFGQEFAHPEQQAVSAAFKIASGIPDTRYSCGVHQVVAINQMVVSCHDKSSACSQTLWHTIHIELMHLEPAHELLARESNFTTNDGLHDATSQSFSLKRSVMTS